ncbi:hypothetical protein J3L16_15485 [Alteromonas sp. 5E99-2]|uniref:hypothetical protein n=1 Tax=Alteromonas sp. 5E99-2 TaxID=2817683 RepID=UPI001A996EE5|nr:hypothetical protein [Alteromonas sp. 5E99-2]MBO1257086.1 hypothetical protein [Alteromonas sp. 5E99-2]
MRLRHFRIVLLPLSLALYTFKEYHIKADFLTVARQEFAFLIDDYSFLEAGNTEFEVNYENSSTCIRVEGINWGFNSRVAIGTNLVNFENYDLHDIVFGCNSFHVRKKCKLDQLEQLKLLAVLLRKYAQPVLHGQHSSFAVAKQQIEKRSKRYNGR